MSTSVADGYLADDTPPESEESWPAPLSLDRSEGPPFPMAALPGGVCAIVQDVSRSMQVDPAMPSMVALGIAGLCLRGRVSVYLPQHSWEEPAIGQVVGFANPAERKSPVFEVFTRDVRDWERERAIEDQVQVAEWESQVRILQTQLKAIESESSRKPKPGDVKRDPQELDLQRKALVLELSELMARRIYPTRIMTDDITPERLKILGIQQGGHIGVVSDEGGTIFGTGTGTRYAKNGGSNIDAILHGHAHGAVTVDRIGADGSMPTMTTPRFALPLVLLAQPHVAESLGTIPGYIERGGAARLWPFFVNSMVGRREVFTPPIPPSSRAWWRTTVRRILSYNFKREVDAAGFPLPCRLLLSDEAYQCFQSFRAWQEAELGPGGRFADIPDWGGKMAGAVLRIAAILHVFEEMEPDRVRIDRQTIESAIEIAIFLSEHAKTLYRVMGAGESGHGRARMVLDQLDRLSSPATRSDLYQSLRGRADIRSPKDLDRPLSILEEFGWIRVRRIETGGRPSFVIFRNPMKTSQKHYKAPTSHLSSAFQDVRSAIAEADLLVSELRQEGPAAIEELRRDLNAREAELSPVDFVAAVVALHKAGRGVA